MLAHLAPGDVPGVLMSSSYSMAQDMTPATTKARQTPQARHTAAISRESIINYEACLDQLSPSHCICLFSALLYEGNFDSDIELDCV